MLFQCSWHMCDSGMHLQLPNSVRLNSDMLRYTLNRKRKKFVPLKPSLRVRRREIGSERSELYGILFMLCWWKGNNREKKSSSFFPCPSPLFVYWVKSNQSAPRAGANFIPYHLMETSKIIPFSWASLMKWLERHSLLGEDPENFSETYFECTAWTRTCSLCWSFCEVSSASLLLQKQKWVSWHFFTYLERINAHHAEVLNPLPSAPTGCSLDENRRAKSGLTSF